MPSWNSDQGVTRVGRRRQRERQKIIEATAPTGSKRPATYTERRFEQIAPQKAPALRSQTWQWKSPFSIYIYIYTYMIYIIYNT